VLGVLRLGGLRLCGPGVLGLGLLGLDLRVQRQQARGAGTGAPVGVRGRCLRGGGTGRGAAQRERCRGGLAGWKWWQKQSNPDWLVEPPAAPLPLRSTPATAPATGASGSSATGALKLDPEVAAKESEAETLDPEEPIDPVDLEAPLDGEDEDGPTR
jgi:hypothetical protein